MDEAMKDRRLDMAKCCGFEAGKENADGWMRIAREMREGHEKCSRAAFAHLAGKREEAAS